MIWLISHCGNTVTFFLWQLVSILAFVGVLCKIVLQLLVGCLLCMFVFPFQDKKKMLHVEVLEEDEDNDEKYMSDYKPDDGESSSSGVYTQYSGVYIQYSGVYTQYSGLFTQYSSVYFHYSGVYTQYSGVYTQYSGVYTHYSGVYTQYSKCVYSLLGCVYSVLRCVYSVLRCYVS